MEDIEALTAKINELKKEFKEKTTQLSQYSTSVKSNDPDEQITAMKESQLLPKVPYYIAGSSDTGEFCKPILIIFWHREH